MIQYEVTLEIEKSIFDEFYHWLHEHIHDMLKIEGFLSAHLYEETEHKKLIVSYEVASMNDLNHYFKTEAATMRESGIRKFGNQFSATRRILKLQQQFNKY